ncbi:nicotinate-nucleotide adenylyltransferase [Haloglycomyces albus]|uniref:nicotinate-nucleotide adenylyltransferase n=1 Tax=Haloglycomyces albus TaxID=526067 RepID=UPI00055023DD|nr:nicotinate-nucleotide adenylyltransferase [Haloglycomyces albus]
MTVGFSKRVGILGGTFDPVHFGHLVAASEAYIRAELDEVVFVPTGDPWQKSAQDVSPAAMRGEMARLAINCDTRFRLSLVDIDREGPTYAVDTVADVAAEYRESVELFFIIGADSLENLYTWHKVEQLVDAVRLIALNRPGSHRREARLPRDADVTYVDMPAIAISSSDCRERVRAGYTLRYLVPEPVRGFIESAGLYLPDSAVGDI